MRLAVLSDLHLAPGVTNRCTVGADRLVGLLDRLERDFDRVIVGGDLFDLDRPPRPGAWRRQLEDIRRAHPRIYERLERCDWVFGNHDYQLGGLGVPERRVYSASDHRVLVLHGHQADPLPKTIPGVPQTANFMVGWMHRVGLVGLAGRVARAPFDVERLVKRVHSSQIEGSPIDRGLAFASRQLAGGRWGIVVTGHSHLLRLVPTPGGLYVNTGALCEGYLDWVGVDTEAGEVEAWRDDELYERAAWGGEGWEIVASAR